MPHTSFDSIFLRWDADNSGTIEEPELARALNGFGFNLSPQVVNLLLTKYSALFDRR